MDAAAAACGAAPMAPMRPRALAPPARVAAPFAAAAAVRPPRAAHRGRHGGWLARLVHHAPAPRAPPPAGLDRRRRPAPTGGEAIAAAAWKLLPVALRVPLGAAVAPGSRHLWDPRRMRRVRVPLATIPEGDEAAALALGC